jgi:hypothetical protein
MERAKILSSPEIKKAMRDYAENGYLEINRGLRSGSYNLSTADEVKWDQLNQPSDDPTVQVIDKMFEVAPATYQEMTLYRGGHVPVGEYQPGDMVVDRGFLSTSRSESEAVGFARGIAPNQGVWEITVPEGAKVMAMATYGLDSEKEELLPRDTVLRVDEVTTYRVASFDGFKEIPKIKATVLLNGSTKSLKHGDHDQSDHGNWAHAGGEFQTVSRDKAIEASSRGSATTIIPSSPNIQRALVMYTSQGISEDDGDTAAHAMINEALRSGYTFEQLLKQLDPADAAALKEFDKQLQPGDRGWKEVPSVIAQDTLLYRGMPALLDPDQADALRAGKPVDFGFGELEPGSIISDAGYGSTSTDYSPAEYFGMKPVIPQDEQTEDSPEQVPVIWKITAPEGTPAMSVDHNIGPDKVYGEAEVILARDTHYRIDDVKYNAIGSIVVSATITPTHPTKSLKHTPGGEDHDQSEHGNWAHADQKVRSAMLDKHYAEQHSGMEWYDKTHSHLSSHPMTARQEDAVLNYVEAAGSHRRINNLFSQYGADPSKWEEIASSRDNAMLSSKELESADTAATIISAFESAPGLQQETTLYRGVIAAEPMEVGQQFESTGFMSTSTDLPTAGAFGGGGTVFQITVPSGTKVLDLYETGLNQGESEVMLNRGTTFEVNKVETVDSVPVNPYIDNVEGRTDTKTTIVHVTVVPEASTKSLKHGDHDQSDHGNWAHSDRLAAYATEKAISEFTSNSEHSWRTLGYYDSISSDEKRRAMGLTEAEAVAVLHYGGDGYGRINDMLRNGVEDYTQAQRLHAAGNVAALDSAISRASAAENTTVYRGTSFTSGNPLAGLQVGGVYTDPGYGSTSTDRSTAQAFGNGFISGGLGDVVYWQIEVPKGTSSLSVDPLLNARKEGEIILPRNTHYRIDSIDTKSGAEGDTYDSLTKIVATVITDTSSKSTKHLPGAHDQDDHGNWATGGTPAYERGKWTHLTAEEKSKYTERLITSVYNKSAVPLEELNALSKEWQSGKAMSVNGNVIVYHHTTPGEHDDPRIIAKRDQDLALIERGLSALPEGIVGNPKFPIEISSKLWGGPIIAQTGVLHTGEEMPSGYGGAVMKFQEQIWSSYGDVPAGEFTETPKWWAAPDMPVREAVLFHEMGHIAQYYSMQELGMSNPEDYAMELQNEYRKEMFDSGQPIDSLQRDQFAISGYAGTLSSEAYAEHFLAYQAGTGNAYTEWLAAREGWNKP